MLRLSRRFNPWVRRILLLVLLLVSGLTAVYASPSRPHNAIRVVQDHGVWWFQDGAGRRFFSLGVNCVGGCYGHVEETPLSPSRKQRIIAWLKDWGFNTAGAWSSPSLWDALYFADQILLEFSETQDDVFDEAFWTDWLADRLRCEVQPFLGQRNFLGYFLDNEREWKVGDLFAFYAGLPKGTPGSRAWLSFVARYYGGRLERLNGEWQTAYGSFDDIAGNGPRPPFSPAMQRGVLKAWRTEVAVAFYRRLAAMVRTLDPDHLILGIRYRGIPDLELFATLSPYFDVNSVNDYNRYGRLRPVYADLYKSSGKPLMITEFSFSGFPEPGHTSDLFVDVYTQERRGLGYRNYVQQAAQAPFVVGMHWFMWMDYSERDRGEDGYPHPPDQNVGLLSHGEGSVYEELTSWAAQTNAAVEAMHQAARWEPPPPPAPQRVVLAPFTPTVDGDIADAHLQHPPGRWWQADFLAIELSAAEPIQPSASERSAIFLFPTGGGPDAQQPSAAHKAGPRQLRPLAIEAAKRPRSGGYTIEARLPAAAVAALASAPRPSSWHVTLTYQNVDGISQAQWGGIMTLE